MAGKFELKTSTNGKYFFNLLASNGQIILSSELYESRPSALNGIESVKKNAVDAARFEKLESSGAKVYFTLKAANHQVIGKSQMYSDATARDAGIAAVMNHVAGAETVDLSA